MSQLELAEIARLIAKEDARYAPQAYCFLRDALAHTLEELGESPRKTGRKPRHVSGPELSHGVRNFALKEYGPLAAEVLAHWGIRSTADIGEVVFNLIEYGFFAKDDADRREDFHDVFDLKASLAAPYEPRLRRLPIPEHIAED